MIFRRQKGALPIVQAESRLIVEQAAEAITSLFVVQKLSLLHYLKVL